MTEVYYYVYKTQNKINGKIYIGKHTTSSIDDKYIGSGSVLRKAIQKHGKHNFKKQILAFCTCIEELNDLEKRIVTEDFVRLPHVYNSVPGGQGWAVMKGKTPTAETRKKISESKMGHPGYFKGKHLSREHRKKISDTKLSKSHPRDRKFGPIINIHTDEMVWCESNMSRFCRQRKLMSGNFARMLNKKFATAKGWCLYETYLFALIHIVPTVIKKLDGSAI